MYDTIHIFLHYSDVQSLTPIEETRLKRGNGSDRWNQDGVVFSSTQGYFLRYPTNYGSVEGWNVEAHRTGYKLKGSLAKWYFGNNIQTLTLAQAIKAIESLGEALGVGRCIFKAKVNRMDFSSVISTMHPADYYFVFLDNMKGFDRSKKKSETTLYYNRKSRDKAFKAYDKVKESMDMGYYIPIQFKGENLFRWETVYYPKEISRVFKRDKGDVFTVEQMLTEETFNHCVEVWLSSYESVMKINNPNSMIQTEENQSLTANDLIKRAVARLINQTGLEDALAFVELDYQVGNVNQRRKVTEAKRKLREYSQAIPAKPYDPVGELNARMAERAREIQETIYQA